MLTSGEAQQRDADGSPTASHPAWKPHPMQGWAPDFVPKLTGEAVDAHLIDQVLTIAGPDALARSRELAAKEGVFVGISAGATFAGALKIAERAPAGANILCMLPDTGERYLSTPLFAEAGVDMTEEEQAIFKSTPMFT
jgi:cysteine synthase A